MNNYLSLFVVENKLVWEKPVPLCLISWRSSQHEAMRYMINAAIGLMFGEIPDEEETVLIFRTVWAIWKNAWRNFMSSPVTRYNYQKEGQKVVNKSRITDDKGLSPKLHRPWEGLYRILTNINNLKIRMQPTEGGKSKVVYGERLSHYIRYCNCWEQHELLHITILMWIDTSYYYRYESTLS